MLRRLVPPDGGLSVAFKDGEKCLGSENRYDGRHGGAEKNRHFQNTLLIFSIWFTAHTQPSIFDSLTQDTVQMILPLVTFFSMSRCASWISSIL